MSLSNPKLHQTLSEMPYHHSTSPTSQFLSQSTTSFASTNSMLCAIESASYESDSICSSDDEDFMDMLSKMCEMDNKLAFGEYGYKKIEQICDTMQGDLCKAQPLKTNDYVEIRRTDKTLYSNKISTEDEDGFSYCVEEDCIEEANILRYLSSSKSPCTKHVVQFLDFFESDTDFFLVTECISSKMNLAQFIALAKEHIDCGKLSMKQYQKTIRQLLQQLFVTMQWLHFSMKCCHLDLRSTNIFVENAEFIQTKEGMQIDENICIKLANFGVAKEFLNGDFLCDSSSYLKTDAYSAPNVFSDERFDARCADNWRLGMIFFECITVGNCVYEPSEVNITKSGYDAVMNGFLESYLRESHLWSQFTIDSFEILNGFLNVNESERLNATEALKMKWFEQ